MIASREFKETKHSGQGCIPPPGAVEPCVPHSDRAHLLQVIACVKRSALGKFKLTPDKSISLNTEDGASNFVA